MLIMYVADQQEYDTELFIYLFIYFCNKWHNKNGLQVLVRWKELLFSMETGSLIFKYFPQCEDNLCSSNLFVLCRSILTIAIILL
jgi:hypothetical protein